MSIKTYPLFLKNEWITSGPYLEVTNPANGELLARVSTIDRPRVAQALQDAHAAFKDWRQQTGKTRGMFLHRIADEVEKRSVEIARLISLENGKPLAQSVGEVAMTVDHLRWFAEEARRAYGRIIPHQVEGKRNLVIKSPVGVVGAISPWNFPLVLGIRKAAPAMAAGCPVLLKPSELTPLSTLTFAECVEAAKLPPGVFQVVLGHAPEIGQEFLSNPLCRKVSFTGSTAVGKQLIAGAAATVKPLSLELGGQAALLVFDDIDLRRAVEGTFNAKLRNAGQTCIAANRIYVQRNLYDEFLAAFTERVRTAKVGDAFEPKVEIGPLINERGMQKALAHIADAVERGARILCGGQRVGARGYFLAPTVLTDVPPDALCMGEETFAPIAPVTAFDTEEEALALANGVPFGLSAYAFTGSLDRAFRLMEGLEAGTIGINDGVPTSSTAPFGGMKQSGWGRELGLEGLETYLETKHVSLGLQI
jgi:succinate-semialdehyde dehydrogenase/glutarate-semialdehyde dehydrogenase